MIKTARFHSAILCGFLMLPVAVCAQQTESRGDSLTIPVGSQGQGQQANLPSKGIRSADVLARFGEPNKRLGGIGEPPISRWVYPGFTVYFEGDTVLHSVLVHQPQ